MENPVLMSIPCRHCGVTVLAPVTDTLVLAQYVILGILCTECYTVQEVARSHMEESHDP